jgi:uncharacterized protein YyaL (SSP411 family)
LLDEPSWVDAATAAGDLLISVHLAAAGDDRLCRTSRAGRPGSNLGVLSDYAGVAEGLLVLHQVTGEAAWLDLAGLLLDVAVRHFGDGEGGFFDTADDAPALVRRPKDPADGAEPSGWLAAAHTLIGYAALTGSGGHREVAERSLGIVADLSERAPRAVGWGLAAASAIIAGPLEVAVVDAGDGGGKALVDVAWRSVLPGTVVVWGAGDGKQLLLHDRSMVDGVPAAYVCREFVCDAPVTDVTDLALAVRAEIPPAS